MNTLDQDARWILLWAVDPAGQCCCRDGSWQREEHGVSTGGQGTCPSVGKHPVTAHGASDALVRADAVAKYGPLSGRWRWGYTLQDLVLLDLDSEAALRSFYRIRRHVPQDKLLGIAETPRGWHVLLAVPGWNQRALNAQMRAWLGDWHGTDAGRITRRGLLLDVRTGAGRYAVWPDSRERGRRWASAAEFRAALEFSGRGMPRGRMVQDGTAAPWNLEMSVELRAWIAKAGKDAPPVVAVVAVPGGAAAAWEELEYWCRALERMEPETGRNNALNKTAFLSGRPAVASGIPEETVEARLLAAAEKCGCPGAAATIRSGLRARTRSLV